MSVFEKMKENMILNQFLPGLVKNQLLLNTFKEVDREKYLESDCKHMAYSDLNIKVRENRYFISPFSLAKIIDKAQINAKDVVLLVGGGTGYESEILSKIASTVMALEDNLEFYNQAEAHLTNNQIENVININGNPLKGCKKYSPYDIIIVLGSLNKPSHDLLDQLSNNGKLLICENYDKNFDESRLFMYTNINKKIFKEYLCDLNLPRLTIDFNEKTSFSL